MTTSSRNIECGVCKDFRGYVNVETSGGYFPSRGCDLYGGNNYREDVVSGIYEGVVLKLDLKSKSWKLSCNDKLAAGDIRRGQRIGVEFLESSARETSEARTLLDCFGRVFVCHSCYPKGGKFVNRILKPRLKLVTSNLRRIKREDAMDRKREKLERELEKVS